MTLAAFLLPAGRLSPILSNFSLRERPPFFDLALQNNIYKKGCFFLAVVNVYCTVTQKAIQIIYCFANTTHGEKIQRKIIYKQISMHEVGMSQLTQTVHVDLKTLRRLML